MKFVIQQHFMNKAIATFSPTIPQNADINKK